MQRSICGTSAITVLCVSLHVLLFPGTSAADVRSPGAGNPFDNLPRLKPAPAQTVGGVQIQKQDPDAALRHLLALRIVPSRFQILGVKTLDFNTVAARFAGMAHREVSVAELLQAANEVTQMYKDKGYPLSFAFVPAQTFQDNVVVINVVEAYVGSISIEGDSGASAQRLRDIAGQLKNDRPLSKAMFERITGVLRQQLGMLVNAMVKPPTTTDGAAEMVLQVKRKALTLGVALDNAVSASDVRGIFSVTESGLTPFGEQITVSTLAPGGSSHEQFYGLTYMQPIGRQGMLFQLSASDYSSKPENQSLTVLQFYPRYQSETWRVGANLAYPLMLDNHTNLTLTGGVYGVENMERYTRSVQAAIPLVELGSNIRALSLELAWTRLAEKRGTQLFAGIYRGVDRAGANLTNSQIDLDFTRFKTAFMQTFQLPAEFGLAFSGSGQYSDSILPSSEQIGFGFKLFGLAYPAGEIAGDQGWGLALELNRAIPFEAAWLKQVQPYVMTDASRVYANSQTLAHDRIASVGAGVRFSGQRYYSFDLSLAKPVGQTPLNADGRPLRLNLSYTYQLD
ncbi:MAG TPA: POTRA domain-containing protein [Herbaspirillum sp.]|nr:POTRA domain-containing protein [Herbaspirillum sp.]